MKKIPSLYFIALAMVSVKCSDPDAGPKPIGLKTLRAEKMSYGKHSYRVLTYDNDNRISQITSGLLDEGDSLETVYTVHYADGRIQKITTTGAAESIEFHYEGGRLTESLEYVNNAVERMNFFAYDDHDRVKAWVILQATADDDFIPVSKKTFTYDAQNNAVQMQYSDYHADVLDFVIVSTTHYKDFDNRKYSGAFFLNFYHPYHTLFQNNPRTWRVENSNGSVGETHFTYEYNDQGYVTRQLASAGEFDIVYEFSMQ
ncbi:hypothetical protein [Chryseolinea lacunae]|uniref:DUF4595 domain-containing protein n=1 Tax=Chryseolinea lacunae TaxID=2801331 RepID=A0ABS1KVA6_9BACT|nr:hypothetical protein [Chryseolinea lacunae]MBL0743157.1 hypothetical protein [Chryseolinea lacunae]